MKTYFSCCLSRGAGPEAGWPPKSRDPKKVIKYLIGGTLGIAFQTRHVPHSPPRCRAVSWWGVVALYAAEVITLGMSGRTTAKSPPK